MSPLQCPGGTFTPGLRSTKEFSDEAVNFVRAHPLMYQPVYPLHKRPLVLSTAGDHRFTSIAVDIVDATDGKYEVLFLGTGESGWLRPRGETGWGGSAPRERHVGVAPPPGRDWLGWLRPKLHHIAHDAEIDT